MSLGIIRGTPVTFFVGAALASFVLFHVVALYYVSSRTRVVREHSPHAVRGENLRVRMKLGNFSRLPITQLWVSDAVEPCGVADECVQIGDVVLPRKAYVFDYVRRVSKPRGQYDMGPTTLTFQDPFGVFVREKHIPVRTPLRVYPTPAGSVGAFPLLETPLWRRVGEEIISCAGHTGEFRGPREYRRGDALSRIHWKATARHRELIVKEFDENAATAVAVFVDFRRASLRGLGTHTTHEASLALAASVCVSAVDRCHYVQTAFIGARGGRELTGTGQRFLHEVLNEMVALRPSWTAESFARLTKPVLGRLAPGATVVFVLGGLAAPESDLAELAGLCRVRALHPVLVLIDDRRFLRRDHRHMLEETRAPQFEAQVETCRRLGFAVHPVRVEGKGQSV